MRYERVFQIWTKMIFKGINNLVILGGEAFNIITNCFKNNVFNQIFVNYPDPPVWEKSQWLLINSNFLKQVKKFKFILFINLLFIKKIYNILKKDQCITIVTDNRGYSKKMVEEFKKVKNL